MSKFSLGVSGIKQETAQAIEDNTTNANSAFYPGDAYAKLIEYDPSAAHDAELFNRLTNEKDHYYSYLYSALFLKEIEQQWKEAGFPISDRPEILATLFNIGFSHSNPNANPSVGGAEIEIAGKTYSFGSLAYEFYYSSELSDVFPY